MLITASQHNALVDAYDRLERQGILPESFSLAAVTEIDQPICHIWLQQLGDERPTRRSRYSTASSYA